MANRWLHRTVKRGYSDSGVSAGLPPVADVLNGILTQSTAHRRGPPDLADRQALNRGNPRFNAVFVRVYIFLASVPRAMIK